MGTKPAPWEVSDVVRIRSHARVRNLLSEVSRANVVARAGIETDLLRRSLEPAWTLQIPEGLSPSDIPIDVLRVPQLAMAGVNFSPDRLGAKLSEADRWMNVSDLGEVSPLSEGSNNWAVGAAHTSTGRPILASDPHRMHSLPSLRYIVHLTAPGIDVIGAGEPAIPGISIGHNGEVAFGLTIFPIDQEDLYVYETNPNDPDAYRYDGSWEKVRTVVERFQVKGAPDQLRTLRFTRHGPIIYEDASRLRAYAVRSVWFEPGTAPYLGSLAYLGARNRVEFASALQTWGSPSVNQIYADKSGNIARLTAGKAPRRPNWDGLFPVPGDGRYEWNGFVAATNLPSEINPTRGYVYSANEMNLPDHYPYGEHKLGFEWDERSRSVRIAQALSDSVHHSIADSIALQCDTLSIPARRLMPVVKPLLQSQPALADASVLFGNWDCRVSRDSTAATLFEVWWSKHLKRLLLECLVPNPTARALVAPGDDVALLAFLEQPDRRLGERPREACDTVLTRSLADAHRSSGCVLRRAPC
jgi:penicillin amidase